MDSRVALVLCLAAVLCQTHGYPRSSEEVVQQESQEVLGAATPSGEEDVRSRHKSSSSSTSSADSQKIKYKSPPQPSLEEKDEKEKEIVKAASAGAKLKVHFPEDSKQAVDDDTDVVRSKKSPDMRDMTYNYGQHPHTTTVCIQVRSDHAPQVVCGPQVGEDKKEEKPPAAARYAPDPYRAAQGPTQYTQQIPPRFPPRPSRPYPGPYMRTEDEPRPAEPVFQPANGPAKGPYQVIQPQTSSPGSVVVHKQYYAPAPPLYGGLPAPSPLRLNCAYQPETSYPYGYPYASPLYRSSPGPLGYVPVASEQVILQEGTRTPPQYSTGAYPGAMTGRSAADPNSAEYYLDPQEIVNAPYPYSEYGSAGTDPWTGAAYQEDAQYHQELQARAAAGDEAAKQQLFELQMRGSPEEARRQYFQEQELRQSRQRLMRLENQLMNMQARAADQEKGVKITMETTKPTSAESHQDSQEIKKSDQPKQAKRQTKVK